MFVPALVAAVWIWPKLRSPRVWFTLFVLAFLATAIWVGYDLTCFLQGKGSWGGVGLRTLYLFVSEPDKPVLQLIFGLFMAGLFSWIFNKPAATQSHTQVETAT